MASEYPSQPPPAYMPPPIGRGVGFEGTYGTGYGPNPEYPPPSAPGAGYAASAPPAYGTSNYSYTGAELTDTSVVVDDAPRGYATNYGRTGAGVNLVGGVESGLPKSELGFDDRGIRRGFIRKVFAIVFCQLLIVCALIAIFLFVKPAKKFVHDHAWIYYIAYGVFIVTYIAIVCCKSVARKVPGNYIFLVILTFALGYMTAMISSYHDTQIVLLALGISSLSSFCIIIFSIQTKIDFTKYIGVVAVLGFVLFFFGLFAIIFVVALKVTKIIWLVYAALGALLFMAYLAIDIQMLMGNKKYSIDPEDYIYAATQIFVDLIYIFLFILSLIGGSSNKNGASRNEENTALIRGDNV